MAGKTRLELTWIGKDVEPRLEPRILIEDPTLSHHAPRRVRESDIFDNRLIHGDNLLALKALEQEYAGKVKCVFIDPPYNTGSAFTQYDDGIEHSLWLSLLRDRLVLLRRLLTEHGTLWITIDDNESHYLKVLADEIFGRANFVANVVWQKKYAPANDSIWFSDSHDHVLVYAKDKSEWRPNRLARSASATAAYKNPDSDPRGPWKSSDYTCNKTADERPNLFYPIMHPRSKKEIWPKRTAVWRYQPETHKAHVESGLIWWGKDQGNSIPAFKRFLTEVDSVEVTQTIWTWEDVGHTQDAKKEQYQLNPENPFATPKPETLLERILHIATNTGDLVVDSFAGSGTTGAVAHKMGRRWIMVELGDHCETHIVPRLKKVIEGQDPGGITEAAEWRGGGGFRYYKLAPSLLERDAFGNWIINKSYNPAMLAEAVCKHEGFRYDPSASVYWQHGCSTERDYIYVTTQTLGKEQLEQLSHEVGDGRSLLVCCGAFRCASDAFQNLTLKKIPNAVLNRCEWGRDDYSLEVAQLPAAEAAAEAKAAPAAGGEAEKEPRTKKGKKAQVAAQTLPLFGGKGS